MFDLIKSSCRCYLEEKHLNVLSFVKLIKYFGLYFVVYHAHNNQKKHLEKYTLKF